MKASPNAKLNIGLNVIGRRPDGYHNLESLFVPCTSLADELEIDEASEFSVEIIRDGRLMDGSAAGDWNPMKDLTVQAYRLLKKEFGLPPVHIRLDKRIPVGAGLGGGSSDAAFALRLLSEMFDLFLPDTMLEIYAAELGSDCPFFVYNSPMFVTGRGEVLEPFELPELDDYRMEVVFPEVSVSTREAYAGIVPSPAEIPLRQALARPVSQWKDCVFNDFEKTVFAAHPALADVKCSLYDKGAVYASMSGSGSAVFGLFPR
ncbi:MAG: 4-(cytidine 5'-diphospho)-2-C-methyl-D-erythritol kinase [Bacteroidales bacterium]|nr:4-(cytidine 5'-diphospho)-2-C-methyl-D-erythritol kinase [Candidatus Hennigimonas equi]